MDTAALVQEGRIPFRIRIGVTGHRDLAGDAPILEAIWAQVSRLRTLVPASAATPVGLAVISQLADGADRLVVQQVLTADAEAQLEVVLPMAKARYAEAQHFDPASRRELEQLLDRATTVSILPRAASRDIQGLAYASAGEQLISRCDVLIALWDGRPPRGRGGTAEMLLSAAARGKPCIWISAEGQPEVDDNLERRTAADFYRVVATRVAALPDPDADLREPTLAPLHDAFGALDDFNSALLPRGYEPRLEEQLGSRGQDSEWVTSAFLRASLLAARNRRWFDWSARAVALLATAAGICLAISLTDFGRESDWWAWAEAGCLVAVGLGVIAIHRMRWHRRWLCYRLLAERLRSAYYLAPTGVDFRRSAGFEAVFVERRSEEWLLRSFEEVWDRRPQATTNREPSAGEVEKLKRRLADEWIAGQIAYHRGKARHHARWDRILTYAAIGLFVLTILVAAAHAREIRPNLSIFLSIALPAAGAALGALLTVRQHRALKERFERMQGDLVTVERAVRDATVYTLPKASSEAARLIAEESGDWFGAMWFLDIEHPP